MRFLLLCLLLSKALFCSAHALFPRYNYFFSNEKPEVWLHIKSVEPSHWELQVGKKTLLSGSCLKDTLVNVSTLLPAVGKGSEWFQAEGPRRLPYRIVSTQGIYFDTLSFAVLPFQSNAVRMDLLTGSLEVSVATVPNLSATSPRVSFLPVGFYAREQDDFDWILRTEAMNGFNLYSPYQAIEDSTLSRRKAYMDLCAKLGLRVNYNLQQVCALKNSDSPEVKAEKIRKIKQEVSTFAHHPALLAWYVSDEPDGQFIAPEELEEAVGLIRAMDPYHPISMVFVDPKPSLPYRDLLDIVMTDPYPIPGNSIVNAGEYLQKLLDLYAHQKNCWIVPQAFGGQEYWSREPTPAELKAMVYLGVMHGARASQAFIRHVGESFPKNPALWQTYADCARELAYLNPDIRLDLQVHDERWKMLENMKVESVVFESKDKTKRTVVVVNLENKDKVIAVPAGWNTQASTLSPSEQNNTGTWKFPFENREVKSEDFFEFVLSGFEVRVLEWNATPALKDNELWEGNKILDPGFEQWTCVGVPTSCYLHMSKDHGATAWLDRGIAHSGKVSLRLNNLGGMEEKWQSQEVSLFQFNTTSNKSYIMSFWAYVPENEQHKGNTMSIRLEKPWGKFFWHHQVQLQEGWHRYDIPYCPEMSEDRNMLEFRISQEGMVWIDNFQVVETPTVLLQGSIFDSYRTVHAEIKGDVINAEQIQYAFYPGGDTVMIGNLKDDIHCSQGNLVVTVPLKNGSVQNITLPVLCGYHRWSGIEYNTEPSLKYPAGGANALIDGILGEYVWDGKWKGYEGSDMDIILESSPENAVLNGMEIRFLAKKSAWVYWPSSLTFEGSNDGVNYQTLFQESFDPQPYDSGDGVKSVRIPGYLFSSSVSTGYRFIRIHAQSVHALPWDHPFVGEKAWLFVDEILVK